MSETIILFFFLADTRSLAQFAVFPYTTCQVRKETHSCNHQKIHKYISPSNVNAFQTRDKMLV